MKLSTAATSILSVSLLTSSVQGFSPVMRNPHRDIFVSTARSSSSFLSATKEETPLFGKIHAFIHPSIPCHFHFAKSLLTANTTPIYYFVCIMYHLSYHA
jgi:hypothetical protein